MQGKIKLVIFDVDGVMTDGKLYYGPNGQEMKVFCSHDGIAFHQLRDAGVKAAVITGGPLSAGLKHRLEALGVDFSLVHSGSFDKLPAYQNIKTTTGLDDSQIAFVGDDTIDLPVMKECALSLLPSNTFPDVEDEAIHDPDINHCLLKRAGGAGAVREAVQVILKLNEKIASN